MHTTSLRQSHEETLSSRQGTQQPWQFLKPDPATAAPDCCKDLRDGLREPCRDELLVASEQRPESARMSTTKCSPLWNWRLGLISLSRVVYYSLLGLVWYGIDGISMLIDIDCILVWLTRLANGKYVYIYILIVLYICGWLCLKTSWKLVSALYSHGQMLNAKIVAGKAMHLLQILMLVFIVRRSLYNIMMHCYLHFTSVQFEWLYRTANALSECTDHDQSYHSSHRSTSHYSAQGTVITPSSVTCVRRDGVRDELRETCARFLALRQLTPQFKQKENVHIKQIKAGFNVTSRHHNTLKSHVFRAWRWLLWHLCSQEVFNLRCLSVLSSANSAPKLSKTFTRN